MPPKDTSDTSADGAILANSFMGAALVDVLLDKGVINIDDARKIVDAALRALGPIIRTPQGYLAGQILTGMMSGKYSKRVPSK